MLQCFPSDDQPGMKTETISPQALRTRLIRRFLLVVSLLVLVGIVLAALATGRVMRLPFLAKLNVALPSSTITTSKPPEKTASLTPTLIQSPTGTAPEAANTPTTSPEPSTTPTPKSPPSPMAIPSPTNTSAAPASSVFPNQVGTIYLSMEEGGYSHLFAYNPQSLPFTRLTAGAWDDIAPAASSDGTRLAFASNRDGHWDLYSLDLTSGQTTRLTDTPEYDGAPTWSPDGLWVAYESYVTEAGKSEGNLEVLLRPVTDGTQATPTRLTNQPAADFSPSWSPGGRQIAFVSNRSGENEIWVADLDKIEDRFQDVSRSPLSNDGHPTWSLDGSLAWAANNGGYQQVLTRNGKGIQPENLLKTMGSGSWPAWSPDGKFVITAINTPNQVYLTGYSQTAEGLVLPPLPLAGALMGLTWGSASLPQPLPGVLDTSRRLTPTPAWGPALTPLSDIPNGRQRLVELSDVEAPYPMLQDLADEAYNTLRRALATQVGWDFLSSLENAFIPLTTPLFPGMNDDWLYTGRAIAVNPAPINAGWMVVVREEYGTDTYWRIYLRARFQDGRQGLPLHDQPWNFNARFSGDPIYFEQGGATMETVLPGYWIDFTRLAATYGWERQPALSTWRSAFNAARYNEFTLSSGLDWFSAMREIYPAEALVTATPVLPPTITPTATRRPTRTPYQTRTPRPTRTPIPTRTATPTRTSTPTRSPTPTTTATPLRATPTP